jgi:hypothetical protein
MEGGRTAVSEWCRAWRTARRFPAARCGDGSARSERKKRKKRYGSSEATPSVRTAMNARAEVAL